MTTPTSEPPRDLPGPGAEPRDPKPSSEPGDRPPAPGQRVRRQLDRAPGERYVGSGQTAGDGAGSGPASARHPVLAPIAVAVLGAAILTLILGVLTSTAGTFAISGLASVAIGLLVANGAIPGPRAARGPGTAASALAAPPFSRGRAIRIAIAVALGMIVLTGIGVWILARAEGGVMDPISYLWTTFGFGLPAQAIVALVGSAWGAANGPVRWRQ